MIGVSVLNRSSTTLVTVNPAHEKIGFLQAVLRIFHSFQQVKLFYVGYDHICRNRCVDYHSHDDKTRLSAGCLH